MFPFAISSRTNTINGSKNDCLPFGADVTPCVLYDLAIDVNNNNNTITERNI